MSSAASRQLGSIINLTIAVLTFKSLLVQSIEAEQTLLRGSRSLNFQTSTAAPTTTVAGSSLITTTTAAPELPEFLEPIGNHTVPVGKDVQLACKVDKLGHYRIAWLRVEDKGILTIHNNIITRNYRIGLINSDIEGSNSILTIKNVQASDKGGYMCQINSVPMKYAIGYVDVLTPPVFDDNLADGESAATQSPGDQVGGVVTVKEGANATLSCRASGHPTPQIVWRRENNEPIYLNGNVISSSVDSSSQLKIEAQSLNLSQVNRMNSGAYLCIAHNGVQPSASRRQVLDVQFKPVIQLPQTEVGSSVRQPYAKLTCSAESNPLGSYHWVKVPSQKAQEQDMIPLDDMTLVELEEITNSDKYEVVIKQTSSEKVQMSLLIRNVERRDFGWFRCIARNALGVQSNSIRFYEQALSVAVSSSTSSSSSSSSSFSFNNLFRLGSAQASDQQTGQQQEPTDQPGKPSLMQSRTHTRSSWVSRSANGGSHNLAPSSPSASSSAPNTCKLHHNPLLPLHLFVPAAAVSSLIYMLTQARPSFSIA